MNVAISWVPAAITRQDIRSRGPPRQRSMQSEEEKKPNQTNLASKAMW